MKYSLPGTEVQYGNELFKKLIADSVKAGFFKQPYKRLIIDIFRKRDKIGYINALFRKLG